MTMSTGGNAALLQPELLAYLPLQAIAPHGIAHAPHRNRQPESRLRALLGRTTAANKSFPKRRPPAKACWNSTGRRSLAQRGNRAAATGDEPAPAARPSNFLYGISRLRPLARRRARTLRPFFVAMRARKPWVRARRTLLGW